MSTSRQESPIPVPAASTSPSTGRHDHGKGPKGTLERDIPGVITVRQDDGQLLVERPDDERQNRALHGLVRSLVNNMVVGVTDGFTKELEIVGVGYRATAQGPTASSSRSASATRSGSRRPRASRSRCRARPASR